MKKTFILVTIGFFFLVSHSLLINRYNNYNIFEPKSVKAQAVLPFPKWLSNFTGLEKWPGMDPPYIPLDFIKFDQIPNAPQHIQGQCPASLQEHCSFDCSNCIQPDDVYTCSVLSQTFDDGPTIHTRKVLQTLDQTSTKSTFFTLGIQNILFPEIYRETMNKGHIMGSHTWSHKFLPSLTNEQIIAQIEWSIWSMNTTGNHLPKWFRPPYGGTDNRVRAIVRQFGMQSVLWDMDTFDWKMTAGRTEAEILKDVQTFKNQKGSRGLILEHDTMEKTVEVAKKVCDVVGPFQMTVPQCAGGINYVKQF